MKSDVSDEELKKVIADFLEMGHVENIISMFRRNSQYFEWTGELLVDERFAVRLGLTLLFEEMKQLQDEATSRAIPSLKPVLQHESPLFRGEAIGILEIINTPQAIRLIQEMQNDPSPQVREAVELALSGMEDE